MPVRSRPPTALPVQPEHGQLFELLWGKIEGLEVLLSELSGRRLAAVEQQLADLAEILRGRHKPFFTAEAVGELTGRTAYTVRRWISEGRIRAIRVTGSGPKGRLLIPREELLKVVASGLGESVPAAVAD